MKKMLNQALLTVGVMGLAYYLYNPKKYNRIAGKAKDTAKNSFQKSKEALS